MVHAFALGIPYWGDDRMKNEKKDVNRSRRRILIVDNYSGLRRALMRLIDCESDLEVCAAAGNVGQALNAIEEQSFDLAIVVHPLKKYPIIPLLFTP